MKIGEVRTISVVANDDDLIFDISRYNSKCVPDGDHPGVNCEQVVNLLSGHQGVTRTAPLLLSLTSAPSQAWPVSRVLKSVLASDHEMGKLGMKGMLEPSVLVLFSYEGYPGVVGSPG